MASKPQSPEDFLKDGIGTLDAGANTGLAPQLLARNQVSMATNMTFRGGYGTHRPPIREIEMNFPVGYNPDNLIRQPFQGACFYQPDSGNQSIVAAIGGRLFQIFPDGTTANVLDISIPNDPNPVTPQQAWLWQCERFVIVNDGVSLPIFFDGNISRRSNGPNKILATLLSPFVVPAVGSAVLVNLTVPYTGPVNISVVIQGAQFTLVRAQVTGGNDATLNYLFGPELPDGHHQIDSQTPIISYPNRLGGLIGFIPQGAVDVRGTTENGIRVQSSELYDQNGNQILPSTNASRLNIPIQIGNEAFIIVGCTRRFNPNTGAFEIGQPTLILNLVQTFPGQNKTLAHHPAGSIIERVTSQPTVTLAETAGPFVSAASVGIVTAPIWTYPRQVVWINDTQFFITPIPNPIKNQVTLVNVTGNPGDTLAGNITAVPELPPGRMGVYGLGRNWMALTDGTGFIASDIVGGSSGTTTYNLRDAPLRITENLLLAGGGAFRVPGAVGDIRAMRFSATLDVSLGQGPLQVFTTMAAFSCNAPTDRTTWGNVTNPILTQSLIGSGALSQSSTVAANGDIIFRAVDGIRSLILARREFDTWGNVPQSREVETLLALDDPTLTQFESAAVIENRTLMSILPSNGPLGVFCQGIIALNFDPISTLRGKSPSIYDGLWTGMNVLQFVQGVFSGVDRCYVLCFDAVLSRIRLFEIQKTLDNPFDNGVTPVTYSMESAAIFNDPKIKSEFDLCELLDGELYLSDVRGVVNIKVWYRPNYSDCWTTWTEFGICANNIDPSQPMQYRSPIGLGSPSVKDCDPNTGRPTRIGLTFQVRFEVTGAAKIRGARFKAKLVPETMISVPKCKPLCIAVEDATQDCEPCTTVVDCQQFPIVLYNLNANKTYSNDITTVEVTCPDNTVQTVVVPANTINFTLPFSPGFTGDYPPLIMNCLSGGVIVKVIPTGATQDQIDIIVNDMIDQCVQAYAQTLAQCGSPVKIYSSDQVTKTLEPCPDGEVFKFTGTMPSWISIDLDTGVVTGNPGVITSTISVADATAQAQAQLDAFVQAQLDNGNITCHSAAPQCLTDAAIQIITGANADGEMLMTRDPATQILGVVRSSDGMITFADSNTNTVLGNTACNVEFDYDGADGAGFAISTKTFFITGSSGCLVIDTNGNVVTTIAPPASSSFSTNFAYDPVRDKIYGIAGNSIDHRQHIIEIDPHTNTITNNVATTISAAAFPGVYYTPGQLVLKGGSDIDIFAIPAFTHTNNSFFPGSFGECDYSPLTGLLYFCLNDGGNNPIVSFSLSTYSIVDTFAPVLNGQFKQYIKFNPVTGAIIAASNSVGEITVIDPVALTIVCEFALEHFVNSIAIDYSNGGVYFLDTIDFTPNNPLLLWH